MSDLQNKLNKIKGNENFLEKIKRFIPGYDGYLNRDNSRELDTQLRNFIAAKLDGNKVKISNITLNLSKAGKLFETQDIDRIDKKNETAIAKFKSAARGYSGAFDIVKIKEEKLEQIYNFDLALVNEADAICALFGNLESASVSGEGIAEVKNNLLTSLDLLISKFDEREQILRNLD
jgi:hypothetical protein